MNNHEHERGVFVRDRENNILQMIADYYEENKSLKEEVVNLALFRMGYKDFITKN